MNINFLKKLYDYCDESITYAQKISDEKAHVKWRKGGTWYEFEQNCG